MPHLLWNVKWNPRKTLNLYLPRISHSFSIPVHPILSLMGWQPQGRFPKKKKLEQSLKLPKPHTQTSLGSQLFSIAKVMNSMILLTFVCNLLVMAIERRRVSPDTPHQRLSGTIFLPFFFSVCSSLFYFGNIFRGRRFFKQGPKEIN